MIPIKPILLFVAKCAGVYLLLIMLYKVPGVDRAFSSYIRTFGAVVTAPFDTKWEDNYAKDQLADIKVRLKHKIDGKPVYTFQTIRTWKSFFMPFAILLALILAYKTSRKQLGKNLLWGMLGLHIYFFIYFLLFLSFIANFEENEGKNSVFYHVFNRNTGYITIVPVIIWALVTFKIGDLLKLGKKGEISNTGE